MNLEAVNMGTGSSFSPVKSEDRIADARKKKEQSAPEPQATNAVDVAPEELLDQIKGFADNPTHGVRFANNDLVDQLVVQVFDQETDELIRQIPPDDLLQMKARLNDLRGNLVNAEA